MLSKNRSLSETKRTCPLTDSKRVHVIDPTISLLCVVLTDSRPSV